MRHVYIGTTEYVEATIYAGVSLSAQAVAFSFDRAAWITAAWTGSAGTQRDARALVNTGNLPAAGTYDLYVRVTDNPEIPVFSVGKVTVH